MHVIIGRISENLIIYEGNFQTNRKGFLGQQNQ